MFNHKLRSLQIISFCAALAFGCLAGVQERPQPSREAQSFAVDGRIALHALMSLSDGHLQKMADILTMLAGTAEARSGEWDRIRDPLAQAENLTVPALVWFALADGSYWTVAEGRAEANLSDRAYFPRVLEGQTVIGELVVSHATGKSVAIVAVPVRDKSDKVVGVLGASVYLDKLSDLIREQMNLEAHHLFYSLDSEPLVGLHMDPGTIFLRPLDEGDPQLEKAIREIISREEGVTSYTFSGRKRTVLYRKSPVTRWWYAFGIVQQ